MHRKLISTIKGWIYLYINSLNLTSCHFSLGKNFSDKFPNALKGSQCFEHAVHIYKLVQTRLLLLDVESWKHIWW